MTPATHYLGKAFFIKGCTYQLLIWNNCQKGFPELPSPTEYRFELFEAMPGRMALRPQMMSQSPGALELLNELVYKCLTL